MTDTKRSDSSGSVAEVRTMLDSVIGAGKSAVHRLDEQTIRDFIESQPGIRGPVQIDRVRGAGAVGASSGIMLFDVQFDTGHGAVTREVVLRHAPSGERRLYVEYDLSRQFEVQRALQGSAVPVPEPLWLDPDGRWLGVPGFIMAFKPGVAPHPSAFQSGPIAEASPKVRQTMLEEIMSALVNIHRTDVKARGLQNFVMNAPGQTPLERCVNWHWRTWDWIGLPHHARLVPAHRWLLDHLPGGEPELTHGDSTLHNYMFENGKLVAVVDWELSTLSRAEADLALQCVGNQIFAPPPNRGFPSPPANDKWLAMYRAAGGRPLENFDWFMKFAAFMIIIAVSALQRNMSEAERTAQEPLLRPCWTLLNI